MKAMIIEDDPMVRDLNHRFLERVSGVYFSEIIEVNSATNALSEAELTKVDLILLDTYMPGMSVVDFLQVIRERKNHAAVIMLTAASDNETVQRTIDYGVTDYLIKPFTFKRFETAIHKFAESHQTIMNTQVVQSQLDELFQGNTVTTTPPTTALPKGLAPNTLGVVVAAIKQVDETAFTNQQIVEVTKLSRISTKKYLNFLVTQNALQESVDYRKVGRPVTMYQVTDTGALAQLLHQ